MSWIRIESDDGLPLPKWAEELNAEAFRLDPLSKPDKPGPHDYRVEGGVKWGDYEGNIGS